MVSPRCVSYFFLDAVVVRPMFPASPSLEPPLRAFLKLQRMSDMQYVLFTDNLADLKIEQVCTEAKQAGFDGVDLTLWPGGHVLPENAEFGLDRCACNG
jgi:hypothetical protein